MITTEQIQSIIDGECSDETRWVLLRKIEEHPASWRALALALLEEQHWSKQISKFAKNLPKDKTDLTTHPGNRHQELEHIDHRSLADPRIDTGNPDLDQVRSEDRLTRLISIPWIPALTASLLLALGFFGGSLMRSQNALDSRIGGAGNMAIIPYRTSLEIDPTTTRSVMDSDMKMLVSGPNKESAEIPIYDLNATDHDLFVAREVYEVARINQRLRKEGFELDVRPEYFTGKLNDGRQLIVPVKHVGLKPYGL